MPRDLAAAVAKAVRWPRLEPPVLREWMPRHIAVIMDGNGRWATRQGKMRVNGHKAGALAVRDVTRYCGQVGVKALTLYAFSTENWKRPRMEIRFLFRLLKKYLMSERAELIANNVRLRVIGDDAALPRSVLEDLRQTQTFTERNTGLTLCLALNYGSRDEILQAAADIAARVAGGSLSLDEVTVDTIDEALFTRGLPPVDLLIRTAGERRLSNFLLWQACGAQFHVTTVCWPDFRQANLTDAMVEFAGQRQRRCVPAVAERRSVSQKERDAR
jgi:undecaprenyl diphosphate synthase